jgi:hypothetical protein
VDLRPFSTINELRPTLQQLRQLYNPTWIIERHGHRTRAKARAAHPGQLPTVA